jgi:tRNA pseudouridine65 synthase
MQMMSQFGWRGLLSDIEKVEFVASNGQDD